MCQLLRSGGSVEVIGTSSKDVDLRDPRAVSQAFDEIEPDALVMAAAKVGGIQANLDHPYEFLTDNLLMQTHLIQEASHRNLDQLIFLGSSCIYPTDAQQPLKEQSLFKGPLETSNMGYALAKLSGVFQVRSLREKMGRGWVTLLPSNIYGPGDNFNTRSSHVLAALVKKFAEAKSDLKNEVEIWGSGKPLREFTHVYDLARAVEIILEKGEVPQSEINVGSGVEVSISELARLVGDAAGYQGAVTFDSEKPDGVSRKLQDSSVMRSLGWAPTVALEDGVAELVEWYQSNKDSADFRS